MLLTVEYPETTSVAFKTKINATSKFIRFKTILRVLNTCFPDA